MAKISLNRASNIWLHPNFIWKYTSLHKEITIIINFLRQVNTKNSFSFSFFIIPHFQIMEMKKIDSAFCKNIYSGMEFVSCAGEN
jgi:hypothetical protein